MLTDVMEVDSYLVLRSKGVASVAQSERSDVPLDRTNDIASRGCFQP